MAIGLQGVFSGIDTNVLVAQLMAINSRPLTRLESRKADWEAKLSAVEAIESRLSDLKTLTSNLRDVNNLRVVYGSTSDKDVLTVGAEPGAGEGSHEIHVEQLAKAHRLVHANGLDELTSLVGAGRFVYTYNGEQRTILTTAETTLANLCELINNDSGNPGVAASVLEYNGDYYLTLNGKDCGADYAIEIDFLATDLLDFDEAAEWSTTQAAQNSKIRVDGFPLDPGAYIERSSNAITDVLPGVTLNLVAAGDATITITRDTEMLKSHLQNVANIYNAIVGALDRYAGYDEETGTGGVLQGDAALTGILNRIRSLLVQRPPGFVDGDDTYTRPAQIGLEIDRDGRLSLDRDVLQDALEADYEAVLALIGAVATGATTDNRVQFTSADESTEPGVYEVNVVFDAGGAITQAQIRQEGQSAWRDMDVDGYTLTGRADNPEQWLTLTVGYESGMTSPLTFEVRVRRGFVAALYDRLEGILDSLNGPIANKKTHYEDALEQLDTKIEFMEERLANKEEQLKARFARLEDTLTRLDAQRGAFEAMIQSLAAYDAMRNNS